MANQTRVIHRYRSDVPNLKPILSTNRILHGSGLATAAIAFGNRVARVMFKTNRAKCIDAKHIKYHKGTTSYILVFGLLLGRHPESKEPIYQYLQTFEMDITMERIN